MYILRICLSLRSNQQMRTAPPRPPASPEKRWRDAEFVWPNGLVFSPDSSKLYLAVSSPEDPAWYVYDVGEDGGLTNRRLFLDGRPLKDVSEPLD